MLDGLLFRMVWIEISEITIDMDLHLTTLYWYSLLNVCCLMLDVRDLLVHVLTRTESNNNARDSVCVLQWNVLSRYIWQMGIAWLLIKRNRPTFISKLIRLAKYSACPVRISPTLCLMSVVYNRVIAMYHKMSGNVRMNQILKSIKKLLLVHNE